MEEIDYSKNWETIFNLSPEELSNIKIDTLDEEDLDALSIRLKTLGETKKLISVYDTMLATDKTNPAVEYTNIFENVIIHFMSERQYNKASDLLKSYLNYDEKQRKGYRNHFIRRNLGACLIFSGKVEEGNKIIKELINESPGDFWTYHDLALEFYFAGSMKEAITYLKMGADRANKVNDDFWYKLFNELKINIENNF